MSTHDSLTLPNDVQLQQARNEARKVFKAQFALAVLENQGVRDFAATTCDGAATAHAALKRAAEIVLKFVNEE